MAGAVPIFSCYVKYRSLYSFPQLTREAKIHGLSHLVNDGKRGSGCEISSHPVPPPGVCRPGGPARVNRRILLLSHVFWSCAWPNSTWTGVISIKHKSGAINKSREFKWMSVLHRNSAFPAGFQLLLMRSIKVKGLLGSPPSR